MTFVLSSSPRAKPHGLLCIWSLVDMEPPRGPFFHWNPGIRFRARSHKHGWKMWVGFLCNGLVMGFVVAWLLSCLFVTLLTVTHQAPLSMGFPRQEPWKSWNGLPFPPPEDLPDLEVEPMYPAMAGGFFTIEPPGKPCYGFWKGTKKEREQESSNLEENHFWRRVHAFPQKSLFIKSSITVVVTLSWAIICFVYYPLSVLFLL